MTTTQATFWDVDETPIKVGGAGQEILDRLAAEREANVTPPKPKAKRRMASTSLAAYDECTASQQRGKVLKAIELAGDHGLTCDELATRWEVGQNTLSGRFTELAGTEENGPWIETRQENGKVITRPTRTGKAAKVWFAIVEDYSEGKRKP